MNKITINFVHLFLLAFSIYAKAEVTVSPITATAPVIQNISVGPGSYQIIPLPSTTGLNDNYRVRINVSNAIYKDITAFIVDAQNLNLYEKGYQMRGIGYQKAVAPFEITGSTNSPGPHFLILDNRYATVITKNLSISIEAKLVLGQNEQEKIKQTFEKLYSALKSDIIFPDFNIRVEPCGQTNAFSGSGGDITYCSEMISELSRSNNIGAFAGIFLHEVGHTLLGLWGIPGNNNEDIADEFATYSLMSAGPDGYALLDGFLNFWQVQNSAGEAQNMLLKGDRHSLSIQRVRNIRENMLSGEAFIQKWNHLIYQHYTAHALQRVIDHPRRGDDVALAESTLKQMTANSN